MDIIKLLIAIRQSIRAYLIIFRCPIICGLAPLELFKRIYKIWSTTHSKLTISLKY